MTALSLIPAAAQARIDALRPRAFATRKANGNVQTITFHRDADDGSDVAVGPYEVLVITATSGAPQIGADQSTSFVGVSGEFQKEGDLPLRRQDRFCLSTGACGSVTGDPMPEIAFVRVPFVIEY